MQAPWKLAPLFKILMFLVFGGLLLLAVLFYREEHSPHQAPTEYGKTQQPESKTQTVNQINSSDGKSQSGNGNAERPNETPKKLVRAWNNGNSQEVAALFTSDATLTMPNGSEIRSKSEIAKVIEEKRAGVLSEATLTNTADEVSQSDGTSAVVRGRYRLDGIKVIGFRTAASGTYVLRQIQRDGKWLISKAEIKSGNDG